MAKNHINSKCILNQFTQNLTNQLWRYSKDKNHYKTLSPSGTCYLPDFYDDAAELQLQKIETQLGKINKKINEKFSDTKKLEAGLLHFLTSAECEDIITFAAYQLLRSIRYRNLIKYVTEEELKISNCNIEKTVLALIINDVKAYHCDNFINNPNAVKALCDIIKFQSNLTIFHSNESEFITSDNGYSFLRDDGADLLFFIIPFSPKFAFASTFYFPNGLTSNNHSFDEATKIFTQVGTNSIFFQPLSNEQVKLINNSISHNSEDQIIAHSKQFIELSLNSVSLPGFML